MLYWVNVLDGKVDNTDQRITEEYVMNAVMCRCIPVLTRCSVEQFTVLFGAILFGNYNVNASIWYILAGGAMNTYFVVKVSKLSALHYVAVSEMRLSASIRRQGCMRLTLCASTMAD